MADSKIEWTQKVWNPVTGCTKVSEGCANCYAERMSKRFAGRNGYPADDPFSVTLHPKRLEEPLKWKKPQRIFVGSMGDLFHKDVPWGFVGKIWLIMERCPQHTFLILTKRPERMKSLLKNDAIFSTLPNVHLGVSVEDQATADERIPLLLDTPAAKRFVSLEPMLGPVEFRPPMDAPNHTLLWISPYRKTRIDGVILGGESGSGARPMHPDWARKVRDDCAAAGVPFFFKQWGENGARARSITTGEPVFPMFESYQRWVNKGATWVNGGICIDMTGKVLKNGKDFMEAVYPVAVMHRVGKKPAGCSLDGVEHKEVAECRR